MENKFIRFMNKIQNAVTEIRNFPEINFKPKQMKVLENLMLNRDVVAVLPTGFGKSIIFQILPYFLSTSTEGIVVVISPLNSIMEDQHEILKTYGIPCFVLKERDTFSEIPSFFPSSHRDVENESNIIYETEQSEIPLFVKQGKLKLLICHPEGALSDNGMQMLKSNVYQNNVKACVIDEAHCIEIW